MTDRPNSLPPTRIEMATSETEGAETITWIDPTQVIGCIAQSQPRDTFGRYVEPRLAELRAAAEETASASSSGNLPERIATVLERLRQVHARLYRENRSPVRDPRYVRLAVTMVESERVYFVKGIRCWVFRVRDGAALRIGGDEESGSDASAVALGSTGRLSLAVTSTPYEPGDVLVLLAAEGGDPPDPRAVAGVLEQMQDLKRACDGIVSLFGMGTDGAGAIALRFVPIQTQRSGEADAATFFEDLSRDLRLGTNALQGSDQQPLQLSEEFPLPSFLEAIGSGPRRRGDAPIESPLESAAMPEKVEDVEQPALETVMVTAEGPAREFDFEPAIDTALQRSAWERMTGSEPLGGRSRRRVARGTVAVIGGVIAVLIAVAGIPKGLKLLRGGVEAGGVGVLRVDSVPPARAIFIDGADQGTGTPAVLEGVAAGVHQIRFDLGPYGTIENQVRIRRGETTEIMARGSGNLEIALVEERPESKIWIRGRAQAAAPCRIDSLTAGWHEVFYEDERIPLWQRPVLIRAGETTRLRIPNASATDRAHLRVESWTYQEGEGLRETGGVAVFIDGEAAGETPLEIDVTPGLHGVRIEGSSGQTWTEVCDLKAGSGRVIAPRFGMGEWPEIQHRQPGRVLARGPILLTVEIHTGSDAPARNPRLHIPVAGPAARDLPLSPVDVTLGTYVAAVDPDLLPIDQPISYYFTVQTPGGETLCSELYRLTIVQELSGVTP